MRALTITVAEGGADASDGFTAIIGLSNSSGSPCASARRCPTITPSSSPADSAPVVREQVDFDACDELAERRVLRVLKDAVLEEDALL
jgi:hypothetical protein